MAYRGGVDPVAAAVPHMSDNLVAFPLVRNMVEVDREPHAVLVSITVLVLSFSGPGWWVSSM